MCKKSLNTELRWFYKKGLPLPVLQYFNNKIEEWLEVEEVYEEGWFGIDHELEEGEQNDKDK